MPYILSQKAQIKQTFSKYLPEEFIDYVVELLFSEKVKFRISKPRKTKRGDYRAPLDRPFHEISVNADLNKYAFLITTLHEFAHMRTFIKFGDAVLPHGNEWKNEFAKLLAPVIDHESFPNDIKNVLRKSVVNLKASSCSDQQLFRVLKKYDSKKPNSILLEELGNNKRFILNGRLFERGVLRRTRYLCKDVISGKQYLVSRLADVEPYSELN